jgi:hypothetical protein
MVGGDNQNGYLEAQVSLAKPSRFATEILLQKNFPTTFNAISLQPSKPLQAACNPATTSKLACCKRMIQVCETFTDT